MTRLHFFGSGPKPFFFVAQLSEKTGTKLTTSHLTLKHGCGIYSKSCETELSGSDRTPTLLPFASLRLAQGSVAAPAVGERSTQMISICVDVGERWPLPPSPSPSPATACLPPPPLPQHSAVQLNPCMDVCSCDGSAVYTLARLLHPRAVWVPFGVHFLPP